ncbi:MAG: flagellar motor protein MotB [Bacillota bacterium]|nr:flagellar motor protein MotB [Bacillota bacterium]
MRPKKEYSFSGGTWLDTYADMVTLMLTFFVLLFAMSTMNQAKWKKMVEAFQERGFVTQESAKASGQGSSKAQAGPGNGEPGGGESTERVDKVTEFSQLYRYLKQYVDDNNLQSSVKIFKGDHYSFLTFTNNVFFEGNSAVLMPKGKETLDYLCGAIKNIPDQIGEIRFMGHTAKDSYVTTAETQIFDRELSMDRAKNCLLYVQLKGIIDPAKLVSEGYGHYRPIAPHDGTEANRIKNRRVEIYISEEGSDAVSLSDIYKDTYKKNPG